MKRIVALGASAVFSAGVAFGAVVGVASAIDGESPQPHGQQNITPDMDAVRKMAVADHIPVVDSKGDVRGTVEKTDLYNERGQAKAYSMLVPVYDDAGTVVGYFSNLAGFVEKNVAEQPGFNPEQYAKERGGTAPSDIVEAK
jgi:hypothetical protein